MRSEFGRAGVAGGLAVVLLVTLAACGESATDIAPPADDRAELVLADGWPDSSAASEPMLPWTLEAQADVIALAAVHQPRERGGRAVLELELTDFLKGRTAAAKVFPKDEQPFLGCIPPQTMPRPSETFPAGSQALVYLVQREGGGLSILQLVRKPDEGTLDAIRRFVTVEAAVTAAEPAWAEVLPPDGRLDNLTHWALVHTRPDGAAEPLRAMLERTLDRAEQGETPATEHLNLLASNLAGPFGDAASLPLFERLARWLVALPDDEAFRMHWPACSPGTLLGQAAAEAAPRWEALLRKSLQRCDRYEYGFQGAANALAHLPRSVGVPALMEALGSERPVVASALTHWARRNPDDRAGRAAVRERAEQLRKEVASAGDDLLTFRRHLDALIEAVKD